jgi:hypothetical protein
MKDKHETNFCSLCLLHRPLFLTEQAYFKPNQLRKHMKTGVMNITTTNNSVRATAGHPLCQFCGNHFYDATDLYKVSHYIHFITNIIIIVFLTIIVYY